MIKNYYIKFIEFIKQNPAYSITLANIFLLVLLFITKDPFSLRATSYEKSSTFLKLENPIQKISIEKTKLENSKMEFVKIGDDWKVLYKGKEIPAEKERLENLVKAFKNARRFTLVSSSKDKNDEYGFNEDEIKVELFSNSNSLGYFLLGSTGKDGNSIHVKFNSENDIYLVEENLKNHTGRGDANYFFNKRISPLYLSSEEIIEVELQSNSNKYSLKKNSVWNLDSPEKGEISNEDMNSNLTKLSSMNADDLIVDESTLKGIDSFPYTIQVKYKKDGIVKLFTIQSAGFDKKLNAYYIRKDNEPSIYKLSEYSIKSILDWKPATLLKK